MSPSEYRAALDRLALSQRGAARFFGRDERTSRTWADLRGNGPPPEVAMWLRYMLATGVTPNEVNEAIRTNGGITTRTYVLLK